ncbi:hypothetical protein [Mastigocoleus testarum]|uniref:Uncharacterized protein n=1 Tax=Mastigocoleus testarum BC008 TaxID=371196 RepID=A0A0V7ZCG7_9CYAN|nr:hypothetical protein [Mastigocoleus testarum]KST62197.1 hypothetical protein BC008_37775 [Mastigocoleus testarum BC008]KST64827.1 hypothetical protein BC008_18605 [Mastigocoleus testarum BC008]
MKDLRNCFFLQSQDKTNGASIRGVALATVTNISEISNGKVKVKFQWRKYKGEINQDQNDEITARIITSDKGSTPSVDVHDVVLIAFEQGSFEYPFIIGFVYPPLKDTES